MEHKIVSDLQIYIQLIDKERDELEQKYFRQKLELVTIYETKTWVLLEQKTRLKKMLNEYQENKDKDLYANEE